MGKPKKKKRPKNSSVDISGVRKRSMRAKIVGMTAYMRDPDLSVKAVWETTPLDPDDPDSLLIRDVIGLKMFARHARKGNWVSERKKLWLGVEQRAKAELQSKIMEEEAAALSRLQVATSSLINAIQGDEDTGVKPVAAKTLEGAVTALVRLESFKAKRRDEIRDHLASVAAHGHTGDPEAGTGGPVVQREDRLSDEEIEEFTKQIVMRRAGMDPDDAEEDEEDE